MYSSYCQQSFISRNAESSSFPKVPWQVRERQLWLVLWYEPNTKFSESYFELGELRLRKTHPDNFFESLNDVFNGTISYRNDSFISHNIYSSNLRYVESNKRQIENHEWKKYKENATSKERYVID